MLTLDIFHARLSVTSTSIHVLWSFHYTMYSIIVWLEIFFSFQNNITSFHFVGVPRHAKIQRVIKPQ